MTSDGLAIIEHPDGTIEKRADQTDWGRLAAMTDDAVEAAARSDPEWNGLLDIDWAKTEIVEPANKVAISIRLDPDILSFFKGRGPGYQKRINAVLRSFVEAATERQRTVRGSPPTSVKNAQGKRRAP